MHTSAEIAGNQLTESAVMRFAAASFCCTRKAWSSSAKGPRRSQKLKLVPAKWIGLGDVYLATGKVTGSLCDDPTIAGPAVVQVRAEGLLAMNETTLAPDSLPNRIARRRPMPRRRTAPLRIERQPKLSIRQLHLSRQASAALFPDSPPGPTAPFSAAALRDCFPAGIKKRRATFLVV